MIRTKEFNATGIAPNGKLYAGDLLAIMDAAAGLADFAQTIDTGALRIGDAAIQLLKFGTLDARITAALRTDGITRALGGLVAGSFTTTQRDAISVGSRPYGLLIQNTTTNRLEQNIGTDAVPVWIGVGAVEDLSITTAKLAAGAVTAAKIAAGTITHTEIAAANKDGAAGTASMRTLGTGAAQAAAGNDARLSDQRTPLNDSVTGAKIVAGHGGADDYGSPLPSSGLFNGYRFMYFWNGVAYLCVYRVDLDGTYPWHVIGPPMVSDGAGAASITVPNAGYYLAVAHHESTNAGTGSSFNNILNMRWNGATVRSANVYGAGSGDDERLNSSIAYQGTIGAGQVIDISVTGTGGGSEWDVLLVTPKKIA